MRSYPLFIALGPATTFAAIIPRILPPASDLPSGWSYSGCYVDSVSTRALNLASYADGAQTVETCIAFCSPKGYSVAGAEFGSECFCGLAIPSQVAEDGCNMAFAGDSSEVCSGPDRLSVYTSGSTVSVNPGPDGWHSLGCYTDSVHARTFTYGAATPGGFDAQTVAVCTSTCGSLGYKLAGVEFSGECFCSNGIENGGVPATDECNMPCKGNLTEFCGGPDRLNVYEVNAPTPPTPSCVPTIETGGRIDNGGFETGGAAPWTFSASYAMGTALHGEAFEGCWAWDFQPYMGTNTPRVAYLISENKVTPNKKHKLTFYLGRRSSATPTGTAKVKVTVGDDYSETFTVCGGSWCGRDGAGGSVWKRHKAEDIEIRPGNPKPVLFTVTWTGTTKNDRSDDVLLDGVLLERD